MEETLIIFIAVKEGGCFRSFKRSKNIRTKIIIKRLIKKKTKCVAVFKNGMIYDGFLIGRTKTALRHIISGGRKDGRRYYVQLRPLSLREIKLP